MDRETGPRASVHFPWAKHRRKVNKLATSKAACSFCSPEHKPSECFKCLSKARSALRWVLLCVAQALAGGPHIMPLVPLTKACSPPSLPGPAALALRPVGLDLRSKPSLPFLDEQALPVFATRLQNVFRQLPGQYSHGLREVLDRDPFVCFPASEDEGLGGASLCLKV